MTRPTQATQSANERIQRIWSGFQHRGVMTLQEYHDYTRDSIPFMIDHIRALTADRDRLRELAQDLAAVNGGTLAFDDDGIATITFANEPEEE